MKKHLSEIEMSVRLLKEINIDLGKLNQKFDTLIDVASRPRKRKCLSPVDFARYSKFRTTESLRQAAQIARQRRCRSLAP